MSQISKDIKFLKEILPSHYIVEESEHTGSLHCKSEVGILKNVDEEDEERWSFFVKEIEAWFGIRFREIFHNTCHGHKDFTIYTGPRIDIGQNGMPPECIEFQVDKKLDNKREPVNATIIKLTYVRGDAHIRRQEIICASRSGYCLDPADKAEPAISFNNIGEVTVFHSATVGERSPQWQIYAYAHKEKHATSLLYEAMLRYKLSMLEYANNCIPDTIPIWMVNFIDSQHMAQHIADAGFEVIRTSAGELPVNNNSGNITIKYEIRLKDLQQPYLYIPITRQTLMNKPECSSLFNCSADEFVTIHNTLYEAENYLRNEIFPRINSGNLAEFVINPVYTK
jgi:hypothetical protein